VPGLLGNILVGNCRGRHFRIVGTFIHDVTVAMARLLGERRAI